LGKKERKIEIEHIIKKGEKTIVENKQVNKEGEIKA